MSSARLARLAASGQKSFVAYMMAGDPDYATALELMCALPSAGVDVIELGMPFTDPMADGPSIQAAGLRALAGGQTMAKTFEMVRAFRAQNDTAPIVLMGYYNPIYHYGVDSFIRDAHDCGVDGLIIVDVPPEEDSELCLPARAAGLDFIRLAAPTTSDARLSRVLTNISGFLYYVSITGITGTTTPDADDVAGVLERIRAHPQYPSDLPIMVGFGVKTPETARAIATIADGVVVGSALVDALAAHLDDPLPPVLDLVNRLANAVHKV